MTPKIEPFSLKDTPSLIEYVLPAQKLSAESYKEQMAGSGKTLVALGSYWKGRKPLILNRACVLGALLPVTQPITPDSLQRDLDVFEMLMGMDDASIVRRRGDSSEDELPDEPYGALIADALRPEQCGVELYEHVWDAINLHLGTNARQFPELVEQLGIMRFGHRPQVADTFSGSGQIPFEAARLGCDVYASDLNPIAGMLTWGAFNIVGGSAESREQLAVRERQLVSEVQNELDTLGAEVDGKGWRAKVFLYCTEARCPQSGWMVPLLPSLVISRPRSGERTNVIAALLPDAQAKRYDIAIRVGVTDREAAAAESGTARRDSKYGEAILVHEVDGVEYRTKISTLRGDFEKDDGTVGNALRHWDKSDIAPRDDDVLRERLYCIQWIRPRENGHGVEYEFRAISPEDIRRERIVAEYVEANIEEWQARGWVPDMRIEVGGPPRYQGLDLIKARGWTHWNHLFNPRQLLIAGLVSQRSDANLKFGLARVLNANSRLSRWDAVSGGGGCVQGAFDNQALNTIYNYGCRAFTSASELISKNVKSCPFDPRQVAVVRAEPAAQTQTRSDIFITDPPYGDAVKYEEILDFFIAWLRKNSPPEFASWVWDSRRALAIKGEDDDFRRGMVAAYKRMTELMPDNGLQIIMFTHQSGSIWADMANIVWASGLHVTAAWYVVTETDSALREGSHVKGTVLLVLRKRLGDLKTGRDDLAWEIQEEVQSQVDTLTGLNQSLVGSSRAPNQFSDADLQMAGYAAALRVLTRYSIIDGRQMAEEAVRPRHKGVPTMVDELIEFAVGVANNFLVPIGLTKAVWNCLRPVERFYLKLLELESRGFKTLDNYQNFAKAFKVGDTKQLMESQKANAARLKSAIEFGRAEMAGDSELANSPLRSVLYALMELQKEVDSDEVLLHLSFNVPEYFTQRPLLVELSGYLSKKLASLRDEEASAARVLRDLIENQRL
jgi:putative DNA methylase